MKTEAKPASETLRFICKLTTDNVQNMALFRNIGAHFWAIYVTLTGKQKNSGKIYGPYFSPHLGSVVGIAPGYGLDCSGIESRWGEIFRCPDRPWGPPSLLYNGYRVFPGGRKRPGRDADPSPPSSAEV